MWITRASGQIKLITPWQVPTKSSVSPKSERKVTNGTLLGSLLTPRLYCRSAAASRSTACDQPLDVVGVGLDHGVDPPRPQRVARDRPDRDRPQPRPTRPASSPPSTLVTVDDAVNVTQSQLITAAASTGSATLR